MPMQQFPTRHYSAGEVLFNRGDQANTFFIIQSGEVDLFVPPANTFLVRLGAGASFGEQAILTGGVRNAKAMAVSELSCTEITAQALQASVLSQQTLIRPVLEALLMQLSLNNAVRSVLPDLFGADDASSTLENFELDRVPEPK